MLYFWFHSDRTLNYTQIGNRSTTEIKGKTEQFGPHKEALEQKSSRDSLSGTLSLSHQAISWDFSRAPLLLSVLCTTTPSPYPWNYLMALVYLGLKMGARSFPRPEATAPPPPPSSQKSHLVFKVEVREVRLYCIRGFKCGHVVPLNHLF